MHPWCTGRASQGSHIASDQSSRIPSAPRIPAAAPTEASPLAVRAAESLLKAQVAAYAWDGVISIVGGIAEAETFAGDDYE